MFQMVIERLFVPELSKVDDNDKKLCAIAMTHLLCDSQSMTTGVYFNQFWIILLKLLLQLFESTNELQLMTIAERKKQEQEQAEEDLIVGLDDTPGKNFLDLKKISIFFKPNILDYTPSFSRLAFTKKSQTDIFGSSIPDARCHLVKCLQTLTSNHPNQVCYFLFY